MAEAIMQFKVRNKGWAEQFTIESCGTAGYHIGENADQRTLNVLSTHGIEFRHSAQQLSHEIAENFDFLIAMDANNKKDIELSTGRLNNVFLMKEFGKNHANMEVNDPYYGGVSGFETCYNELDSSIDAFMKYLSDEFNLKG
jgi:protein-tyrosine-phosphatase